MAAGMAVEAEQQHVIDPFGVQIGVADVVDLEPLGWEDTPTSLAPAAVEQDDVPPEAPPVRRTVIDGELLQVAHPTAQRLTAVVVGVGIEATRLVHECLHLTMTPFVVVTTQCSGSFRNNAEASS